MKQINLNKKGSALVIAILVVMVVMILSAAYVAKAVLENAMAHREISSAKALYLAEGSCQTGLYMLSTLINTYLLNTVQATAPSTIATAAAGYSGTSNQLGFLVSYAKNAGASEVVAILPASGTGNPVEVDYPYSNAYNPYTVSNPLPVTSSTSLNGGTYVYTIRLTPAGNVTSPSTNVWVLPFYYRIDGTGTYKNQTKEFTLNGYFTVQIQMENFARFALFTQMQTYNNNPVWFTSSTNFSGPVFTGGQFNFAYNPSATFTSTVQQVGADATFYNNGNPINLNANANGTIDTPDFEDGFTRSLTNPPTMPNTSTENAMITDVTAGNNYANNGVYLPSSHGTLTGGIYVNGDANSVSMSVNGSNQSVYTIAQSSWQGTTTTTVTVNAASNQTTVQVGSGSPTTYTGLPNGANKQGTTMLYVNGNIDSLAGTVQGNAQVLIASTDDTVIQNNITYSNYTPGSGTPGTSGYVPPSVAPTDSNGNDNNVLGILSWGGNIRIGTSAPNNVNVDATLMAAQGVVTVDNYDTGGSRGVATILGGVISDQYGPFGTFTSSSGNSTGYGRNFVYDQRMNNAQYAPPDFPTVNVYMASSNNIGNDNFWQTGGF